MLTRLTDAWRPLLSPEPVFLALGGNVGDRAYYLNRAVELLGEETKITVEDVSMVFESVAVTIDGSLGNPYYNMAVRATTTHTPLGLLKVVQRIELWLGRVRTARWSERTVDIDIALFGDRTVSHPRLTIPHIELTKRPFVTVPLMEIAPGWALPDGRTLATITAQQAPIVGLEPVGSLASLV